MKEPKEFGRWLCVERSRAKMSLKKLCETSGLGCCSNNINRYELGDGSPTLTTAMKLVNALGFEIQILSPAETELIEVYRRSAGAAKIEQAMAEKKGKNNGK